jgi:hypothetical protein
MLVGHVESWQANYGFEKFAKSDVTTSYASLTTTRMAKKIES